MGIESVTGKKDFYLYVINVVMRKSLGPDIVYL